VAPEAGKQWRSSKTDAASARTLARVLDVSHPLAMALVSRGFQDPDKAKHFLNPRLSDLCDPFSLPGMSEAVDRIRLAISKGQRIAVYGDYDADGVTGTVLAVSVLRALGADVCPFLPCRLTDGYGLTVGPLDRCLKSLDPELVITVDCGTGAVEAVEMAGKRGVDVIVTDHHEPGGAAAPAVAVVNCRICDIEDTKPLAGVGVVFKLCHALVKDGLNRQKPEVSGIDLRDHLDLVAIGTVADVVPLLGENRILVRHGLARLNRAGSPGLAALKGVVRITSDIDCYHIGFILGPRLNAAGRLGSADAAMELLMTENPDRAQKLAGELDGKNRERREIEERIASEAEEEIDSYFDEDRDFGLVAARAGWHVGTIGIVASRLCSKYRRPTALIAVDETGQGRGSCRSIEEANIVEVLKECSDLLESFGGHKMAAGLAVRAEKVDAFRERFNAVCASKIEGRDVRAVQNIDAWITLGQADQRLCEEIRRLSPFGVGNPTPVWGVREVRLAGRPRVVGKDHLKMVVVSGGTQMDAIAFGMAGREVSEGAMDILFHLQENSYMGRTKLQLNVKDFRPAFNA